MTGTVGSGAGALRRLAFTVLRRHATKRTLINLAFRGARERHTVMFKLDDRGDGFTGHVLDRILVTEPVGTLDGVVHVPQPMVLGHIAERSRDAALRRDGVRTRRENLGDVDRKSTRLNSSH